MAKINITPRPDWILVQPDKVQAKVSAQMIVTPDSVEEERKATGTVLAVGTNIDGIKAGDKVIYGVYGGEDLETEEKGKKVDLKFLKDEDIIAIDNR